MPDRRLATTGRPVAMASISTTGMPSRLPLRVGTLGATSTSAAASSAGDRVARHAPGQGDQVGQAVSGDPRGQRVAVGPVPDEPAA